MFFVLYRSEHFFEVGTWSELYFVAFDVGCCEFLFVFHALAVDSNLEVTKVAKLHNFAIGKVFDHNFGEFVKGCQHIGIGHSG